MKRYHLIAKAATIAAMAAFASPASASQPTGVWIDHTGRGGVEITQCGANLCGKLVWLKDSQNKSACGTQILGNVKPMGPGVWDKGWIYDPEERSKYDVELKPLGPDRLRVVGYMGTKFLSETMIWKRAPADLQLCGGQQQAKAETAEPVPPPPLPPLAKAPLEGSSSSPAPAPVAKAPVEPAPANPPAESKPADTAEAPAADEPESKPRKGKAQRTAKRECRLDLPYIKVTYKCFD